MDFREVKDRKYVLQREILSLMIEFETATEASVSSIDVTTTTDMSGRRTLVSVNVGVKL